MVHKSDDRPNAQIPNTCQSLVRPSPTLLGYMALPRQPEAQGLDAEFCNSLVIVKSLRMTGELHLVEIAIADPVARVFNATPNLNVLLFPVGLQASSR